MLHGTWCFFFMCINSSVKCQDYVESVMNEWAWSINGVTVTGHIPGLQVICKQLTAWTMMWAHVLSFSPSYASCVLLPNISTLKYITCNSDSCVVGVWYIICLGHGSPTCGLLACTMWPTAAFLNYVCTKKKLHNNLDGYIHCLLQFIHMWPENQSAITIVALCHKKDVDPWSRREN